MNSESLKSSTPPSLQSYCLPVEVSLKEPHFLQKTCHNARTEVGPALQHNHWLAQMYHLLQSVTFCSAVPCLRSARSYDRQRERQLASQINTPVDVVATESNLTPAEYFLICFVVDLYTPSEYGHTRQIVHRPQLMHRTKCTGIEARLWVPQTSPTPR